MQNSRNTLIITIIITMKSKVHKFCPKSRYLISIWAACKGVWLVLSVCRASVQPWRHSYAARQASSPFTPIHAARGSSWSHAMFGKRCNGPKCDTIKRSQRPCTSPSQTQRCFCLSPVLVSAVTVCMLQRLPHHQSAMETLVKLGLWQKTVTRTSFYSF